jgi:hypothetical protein
MLVRYGCSFDKTASFGRAQMRRLRSVPGCQRLDLKNRKSCSSEKRATPSSCVPSSRTSDANAVEPKPGLGSFLEQLARRR